MNHDRGMNEFPDEQGSDIPAQTAAWRAHKHNKAD